MACNKGWRTHELVILPLAGGAVAGQRLPGPDGKVNETGSLGEASNSCAGAAGDGIKAGTVGWTTVTLAPGRYELACNLPNHYADGDAPGVGGHLTPRSVSEWEARGGRRVRWMRLCRAA